MRKPDLMSDQPGIKVVTTAEAPLTTAPLLCRTRTQGARQLPSGRQ